jgi:hypothetical protein
VVALTAPLEHDPRSVPALATPFTHFLNGWGALRANERLDRLSIHDVGTPTRYPAQEGLIDRNDDACGVYFPQSDGSILEEIRRALPAVLSGEIWSR